MVCIGILIGFIIGIALCHVIHNNRLDYISSRAKELVHKYDSVTTINGVAYEMYEFLREIIYMNKKHEF